MSVELLSVIEKVGYGVASFALCCWLVRMIAVNLSKHMESLTISVNQLVQNVNKMGEESKEAHRFQKDEHTKILELVLKN